MVFTSSTSTTRVAVAPPRRQRLAVAGTVGPPLLARSFSPGHRCSVPAARRRLECRPLVTPPEAQSGGGGGGGSLCVQGIT